MVDKKRQVEIIRERLEKRGISSDLVDIFSLVDSEVSLEDNWETILEEIGNYNTPTKEIINNLKGDDKPNFFLDDEQIKKWDNEDDKKTEGNKLKILFGDKRIVLMCGIKNCGKTNNIIALILDFRKTNTHTPIFLYGINEEVIRFIQEKVCNIYKITSLKQMKSIKNGLIIVDEFQKLKLNDRHNKDALDGVCDMIYHKDYNNKLLLCSPNLREVNSIIGSRVERWACKSINFDDLVRGSQLKRAVEEYAGGLKIMNDIVVPKNRVLILGEQIDTQIVLPYIKEADDKRFIEDIFSETKKVENQELMVENETLMSEKSTSRKVNLSERLSEKKVENQELMSEVRND